MKQITNYLNEILPDAKCELNYTKDYELLIATMLSAQTTDKRVNEVTSILFKKYNNLEKLSKAKIKDIENIIRSLGTYHIKAFNVIEISKILLNEYNGIVPNSRTSLEKMPGVGRKTTNLVLANIYNEPLLAVDTHVKRVSKRIGIASLNDDEKRIERKLVKYFDESEYNRVNHQLLLLGRYICTAKNPKCKECLIKCQNEKEE